MKAAENQRRQLARKSRLLRTREAEIKRLETIIEDLEATIDDYADTLQAEEASNADNYARAYRARSELRRMQEREWSSHP